MNRFPNKLVPCILVLVSTSVFSSIPPIEINIEPNKPVVLTNTNKQALSMLCEAHLVASVKNSISIQVISGKGKFNGTTFKQGDYLVWTLTNMQQIPVLADSGTKALVTNLGTHAVKALCN
ncbi:hypothetical protein Lpar_1540 [Legionella parisiensis]|uniref:Uncharacterized protein n=1 Tax=Legionella parisiensis TaxID=45071 RepID=A0A1E5JQG7_9GAMM|nr:hypothetical protein [Legionella parisiensis]KTD40223.1 hypothetical protein Lpar_1540 [Legionella parisiensis]OEH46769.1 hypothetical protein lpari_02237 [Legionella parisiensis]STX77665.1 Uncharacterised protein [Legionella parisiensis]